MKNFTAIHITPYLSETDYARLLSGEHSICLPDLYAWPTAIFTNIRDLSSAESDPVIVSDGIARAATYLPKASATSLNDPGQQIPFVADNRLLVRNESVWEVWKITGGVIAEATPESTVAYVPDYPDTWVSSAYLSGFDVTHPGLCGIYWRADAPHQSWNEVVKSNLTGDDWRVKLSRARTYAPIKVPYFAVRPYDVFDLTWRSTGAPAMGYSAGCIMEYSTSPDFWLGINSSTWTYLPSGMAFVDPYYETTLAAWLWRDGTFYIHCKRHDSDGTESAWSPTVTINCATERSDGVELNDAPANIPYYCYRDYMPEDDFQNWGISIGTPDEDVYQFRLQIADENTFSDPWLDTTRIAYFLGYWNFVQGNSSHNSPPLGIYYVRVRSENEDGSVVSAWSNIFQLNSTTHVSYYNSYDLDPYGTYVEETHDTSVESDRRVIAFLGNNTLAYAILYEVDETYLYTVTSGGFTRILLDVSLITAPTIIAFGEHVYVGYFIGTDYNWRDITGGVIGERHTVSPPSGDMFQWATLANIYGKLEVVASVNHSVSI